MKYLCLIYASEIDWANMPKEQTDSLTRSISTFTNDIKKSGHYIAGDALQPTHTPPPSASAKAKSPPLTALSQKPKNSWAATT